MNCARMTIPDDSSASAALRGRSVHRYRCTRYWSVPCVDMVRKQPPMTPAQKVNVFVASSAKSNTRNLP